MTDHPEFPEGMEPLGSSPFQFRCHPGVSCFTVCCHKVDLILYPYDVMRLKNKLGIRSEEFMQKYAKLVKGANPYFPTVMLQLDQESDKEPCPFLKDDGCSVYEDRPTDCRTYPLERAVARESEKGRRQDFYFLTNHDYCKGHDEDSHFTVREWIRNQRLDQYNTYNELWTELDTLFSGNPWAGEGAHGPKQQMAFMVCYNLDGFRDYAGRVNLLDQFRLSRSVRRGIEGDDGELLKFGFEWIKYFLTGKSSLMRK